MIVFKNPFLIYIVAFVTVLLLCKLEWSTLFPPISNELYLFLIITFFISFYFAALLQRTRRINYKEIIPLQRGSLIMVLIFLGYVIEFIYYGGIPVFTYLSGSSLKFIHFGGIPTFHVLLISFNLFYSVYLFHVFISTRKIQNILYYLLSILPPFLIFNRGMFINIFIGSCFVFMQSRKNISFKQLSLTIVALLVVLYIFGLSGNYRVSHNRSSEAVLKFYEATPQFKESIVPNVYLWSYMYFAAPIGNVQNYIQNYEPKYSFRNFILKNIIPDFVAKRIIKVFDIKMTEPPIISPTFNVGSMYFRAYYDYGWLGMTIVFFFQCFLIFITMFLLPKRSSFSVTGIAVLSTIVFLNTFANIMIFSGISFQLFWIIIFGQFEKYRFKFNSLSK